MLFGLSNAPASFQDYINKILLEKLDIFIIIYLDDIFIYIEDQSQGHVEAVRLVLDLLRKYGLFINLKKCRFHKNEVQFLGYIVSSQGIRMEDKKIEVVKNWPKPKSVRDIHVFIGFANFYQRFIWGFNRIAAPLTPILKMTGLLNLAPRLVANDDEVVGGSSKTDDKNLSKKPKNAKFEIQICIGAMENLHS